MLDERALRYFIAAAEMLHIGRAAEQLGIAQPALSQYIKAFEGRLSVRLFHRAHRGVELNEAGRVFLDDAKQLLAASQGAVTRVRQVDKGNAGELHIGYSGSVVFEPAFQRLLQQFRDNHPAIKLCMREDTAAGQVAALDHGELDVALVRGPIPAVPDSLRATVFATAPLVVALPMGHRLLGCETVRPADLAGESLIGYRDPPGYGLAQDFSRLLARADVNAPVVIEAGSLMSVLGLVSAGLGIGIVPLPPRPCCF